MRKEIVIKIENLFKEVIDNKVLLKGITDIAYEHNPFVYHRYVWTIGTYKLVYNLGEENFIEIFDYVITDNGVNKIIFNLERLNSSTECILSTILTNMKLQILERIV